MFHENWVSTDYLKLKKGPFFGGGGGGPPHRGSLSPPLADLWLEQMIFTFCNLCLPSLYTCGIRKWGEKLGERGFLLFFVFLTLLSLLHTFDLCSRSNKQTNEPPLISLI
jgi:hypothetical protein